MGYHVIKSKSPEGDRFVRVFDADPIMFTDKADLAERYVSEGLAIINALTLPAAEAWHVVELDAAGEPMDLVVKRDDEGLYVEVQRTRLRGDDLPGEGTSILSASSFCDDMGRQFADVEWSGDSPSGRCAATIAES
jgi:hypothetical protein